MKKVQFGDLVEYLPKSKRLAKQGNTEGKYPFYSSSSELTKFTDEYDYKGNCMIFGTGGNASIHFQEGSFSTSTDCIVAKIKNEKEVFAKYVYLYFKSNMNILKSGFKGAGLKHISKGYISNIQIPLPPIDEQIRIADILDRAVSIIVKRKETIRMLDEYLKSAFIEMFGKRAKQYEKWPVVEITDLAKKERGSMRTGPFGSNLLHGEFKETGDVAVLGIDNAVNNKFVWKEKRFITFKKYENLKAYTIRPLDVIITIMGTVGRTAVIPENIPLSINTKHLAAISFDPQKANPYFIAYSMHSNQHIISQLFGVKRGAIMHGLNLGIIKKVKTKCPPIELQNKFAKILNKTENMKSYCETDQSLMNVFFNSLSQRMFK